MTQDQILKEIEDMMSVVKKEKETLEKILANLEADNDGKPDAGDSADLTRNQ
ncbi:MAG: hypothetical protein JRI61_11080 [Deltaproteobacteria bacterium]|nr:hypothetical protein [Deltaproteobacteria bacterium]